MAPELVYFGSLIQRTSAGRTKLQRYLRSLPASARRFYDVNFRDGCTSADILIPSLEQTDILKLNDDELLMAGKLAGSDLCGEALIDWLMQTYEIEQIALTRGPDGCALYTADGKTEARPGPLRREDIIDTVGAGDAFAAMLVHCIINERTHRETLQDCTELAEFICTIPGAIPEDNGIYTSLTGAKNESE
jgi:fructokinase